MERSALRASLVRDLPLRLAAWLFVAVGAVYLLPIFEPEQVELLAWYVLGHVLLVAAIFAVLYGLRRVPSAADRRFWHFVTAALVLWLSASLVEMVLPDLRNEILGALLIDGLYAAYYLTLVFATEVRPDLRRTREGDREAELLRASTVSFILALLIYCSLIPSQRNPEEYLTGRFSVLLYLCLDTFFLFRFAYLSRVAESSRWRVVYGLFCVSYLVSAGLLGVQFHDYVATLPLVPPYLGTRWDLLWYLPLAPLILAPRLSRYLRDDAVGDEDESLAPRVWEPLAFYAIAFPLLHLLLDFYDQLRVPSRDVQQVLVILYFVFFGVLALVHGAWREKKRRLAERESERRRAESERMARLASLGQFSAAMAHEIRNPLASIVMHSFFLAERLPEDDESRRTLADINAAVERMQKLVNGILGFVRPRTLHLVSENLVAVIESARLELSRQNRFAEVAYVEDYRHRNAVVEVDVHLMVTVFTNLLDNALRAMPEGGTLTLRTENPARDRLTVTVEDTGTGIAEEDLDRVFEPFFSRRDDGVGLGLALAARILDQHDCGYRVESGPGAGTRFILDFNLSTEAPAGAARDGELEWAAG